MLRKLNLKHFLNTVHRINFNKIKFDFGVDSTINVSGALGCDLDLTKGMYWTWQSGYVNFKMEGTCSGRPSPKNDFEFHLGGHQIPFSLIQKINVKTITTNNITISLNLHAFFSEVDLAK